MNKTYQDPACYSYEGGISIVEPPEPERAGQDTQGTSNIPVKLDSSSLEARTQTE